MLFALAGPVTQPTDWVFDERMGANGPWGPRGLVPPPPELPNIDDPGPMRPPQGSAEATDDVATPSPLMVRARIAL
ncbi:hypothetical protein [Rhodococcoides kroppenstedtii]|uniref:hypothetical protein n=1 Tax=Rhodococcoides kroppenstedtii TaxID=293050 RepID=UPI001FCDBF57|nr:hypothetical protein [Rhodococcus kroppenstedtii]